MKILVTGGAGYIGSHTVAQLCEDGYDVAILDNLSTSNEESVVRLRKITGKKLPLYKVDIRDKEEVRKVLREEKIEAIIHFAAYSLVGESMVNPLKYYENNLYGTKQLLEAMLAEDVNKIVFSSTAATYGEPKNIPILETDDTNPTNTYGETKLSMEKMFKWTANAHGLKYVSLRYFNACGAHVSGLIGEAHNPETHLIPIILQAAAGVRESISVYGTDYPTRDGTCVRDYIHVYDLAKAHVAAVKYLLDGGESDIFNLGTEIGSTVKEVIDAAKKITCKNIKVIYADRRAGDPAVLTASNRKAQKILGWKPEKTMDDIISSAWKWHSENPKGY